jgi:hypothetical protein
MLTGNATEIAAVLAALNETGGIPISVSMVAEQNAGQFWTTMAITLLGSVFILIYLYQYLKPMIGGLTCLVRLWQIRRASGRHILLMKHTRTDLFSQSMIETKTLYAVEKALKKFGGEPFDLILHTPGGEVFATQLLSTVLRAYPGRIRAIVPVYAMSGGTFLALSCDEILLGETACLGPVDPQVGSLFSRGSARAWQEVVRRKGRRADDFSIQMAFLGKQYTQTLERTVDDLLARKVPDPAVRARAVERLTSGEVEHGRPLTVADLWGLGIPVQPLDGRAKALMLDLLTAKNIEGVYAL